MENQTPYTSFLSILTENLPVAIAWISGNDTHPSLSGLVRFYKTPFGGVLVNAEIFGLPNKTTEGSSDFYAMHIHEFGDCTMPFDKTGGHYNPTDEQHPQHAGDMPPLLGNQGYAWLAFYTKRFSISDILGRSVIIHAKRDDFTTQPSGNSGDKIGCGVIRAIKY